MDSEGPLGERALVVSAAGRERIDDLAPLWVGLHEHLAGLDADLGPLRPPHESWRRRRARYDAWLAAGAAFLLVADRAGTAVGYAVVRPHDEPEEVYAASDAMAELETLAVAPGRRGAGVGRVLMDAVRAACAERGIATLSIGVVAANAGALRFYEREGARPFAVQLWLDL
jgi:GNAT superfamily N-acetyltransferase